MALITPIEFNMNISRNLLESRWENPLLTTIQKIATYTLIPFIMIATFEAVVKNLIFINLANLCITVINTLHSPL